MQPPRRRNSTRTKNLIACGALGAALAATATCESSRPTALEETDRSLLTHATLVTLRVADSLGGVVLDPRPTDDTTIVLFAQDTRTRCKGLVPTIKAEPGIPTVGTSNTDVIVGTNGADRIDGRGGDDVICGLRGADVLLGGGGNDVIHGNEGTDSLFGHGGSDVLAGHGGTDVLVGGDGDDTLKGGTQPDTLLGEGGNDVLAGNAGPDLLDGGAGADSLVGGGGNDALLGQGGGDRLIGGAGRDQMNGGPGADLLLGGAGPDTLLGGEGNDELFGEGDADWLDGGDDNDVLHGGPGADRLLGREGRDQLFGAGGKDTLQGGPDNDRLRGDDGNDVLRGGDGEDDLRGGDGDDDLMGQEGGDALRGNPGNDVLDGGPGVDDCGGGGQAGDTQVRCEGVTPDEGFLHAPMDFGAMDLRIGRTTRNDLIVSQIWLLFDDWTCGSTSWDTTTGGGGWVASITDGFVDLSNRYVGEGRWIDILGWFDATDHAWGTWNAENVWGTTCAEGKWEGELATSLYLAYDDGNEVSYLSTEKPPSGNQFWVAVFAPGQTFEWRTVLDGPITNGVYTFVLYLASGFDADDPDGLFDVSVVVDDGESEQVLTTTTFQIPYADVYRGRHRMVLGDQGGAVGDMLILRVTFTGPPEAEIGELAFGHEQLGSLAAVHGPVSWIGPGAPGGVAGRMTDRSTVRIERFEGDTQRRPVHRR